MLCNGLQSSASIALYGQRKKNKHRWRNKTKKAQTPNQQTNGASTQKKKKMWNRCKSATESGDRVSSREPSVPKTQWLSLKISAKHAAWESWARAHKAVLFDSTRQLSNSNRRLIAGAEPPSPFLINVTSWPRRPRFRALRLTSELLLQRSAAESNKGGASHDWWRRSDRGGGGGGCILLGSLQALLVYSTLHTLKKRYTFTFLVPHATTQNFSST